jgi:hypothetical protein
MAESWLPIRFFSKYEASSLGRIRTIARDVLTDEQIFKAVGEVTLLAAQHKPWPECTSPLRVILEAAREGKS